MRWLWVLLLMLAACGSSSESDVLPLADDRPTFVFFFTDN